MREFARLADDDRGERLGALARIGDDEGVIARQLVCTAAAFLECAGTSQKPGR